MARIYTAAEKQAIEDARNAHKPEPSAPPEWMRDMPEPSAPPEWMRDMPEPSAPPEWMRDMPEPSAPPEWMRDMPEPSAPFKSALNKGHGDYGSIQRTTEKSSPLSVSTHAREEMELPMEVIAMSDRSNEAVYLTR